MKLTQMSVQCPGVNQLPRDYQSILPMKKPGVLYAPDQRVPIHRDTLKRFVQIIQDDRPTCYVPEIRLVATMGMPQYQPLLYYIPAALVEGHSMSVLKSLYRFLRNVYKERKFCFDRRGLLAIQEIIADPRFERVTETTKDEQLHYFVDHFSAICPQPSQVSVILSNTCNLKCIMCPYHSPEIKPSHTTDFFSSRVVIPWETMNRVAAECGALKIGVKTGNIEEPLLHPRLIDFIRLCRRRGVPSFHITSNGLTLTEDKIRELYDAGLTSIYISMDAARPDTYKRVRGAILERVEANVRKLVTIREETKANVSIRTSFVRNKGVTLEEADEFRDRWLKEVDGVIFYNLAEYEQGNSRFVEIHDFVTKRIKQANGRWPCLSPFTEMYILPDGRVYYCCETVSKLAFDNVPTMGSYPRDSILQLWDNEMFRQLRRDLILDKLDNQKACKDCGIWMAHAGQVLEEPDHTIYRNMITEVLDRKKSA